MDIRTIAMLPRFETIFDFKIQNLNSPNMKVVQTPQPKPNEVSKELFVDLLIYLSPFVVSNYLKHKTGVLVVYTEQPMQQYIDTYKKSKSQYPPNLDR